MTQCPHHLTSLHHIQCFSPTEKRNSLFSPRLQISSLKIISTNGTFCVTCPFVFHSGICIPLHNVLSLCKVGCHMYYSALNDFYICSWQAALWSVYLTGGFRIRADTWRWASVAAFNSYSFFCAEMLNFDVMAGPKAGPKAKVNDPTHRSSWGQTKSPVMTFSDAFTNGNVSSKI